MKRFTIPCDFGGQKAPFHIYVQEPAKQWHPLYFQSLWLTEMRGGQVPPEVMDSFKKLQDIAIENSVSFEELCVYALGTADNKSTANSAAATGQANIDVSSLVEKENQVIAIAEPRQLKSFFDGEFNLLFVICRNQLMEVCHALLFTRANNLGYIKELVEDKKIIIEELLQYGFIEYMGKGDKIEDQVMEDIVKKYHLPMSNDPV